MRKKTLEAKNKQIPVKNGTSGAKSIESYWLGLLCGANLWFGGFPYPVNPGRPEWEATGGHGPGEVRVGWRTMTDGLVAWGD